MANPFFHALGGSHAQQGGRKNVAPNLLQFIRGFQGNPIEAVQSKLNNGEWTKEQYNELHKAAEEVARKMMSIFPHK